MLLIAKSVPPINFIVAPASCLSGAPLIAPVTLVPFIARHAAQRIASPSNPCADPARHLAKVLLG
ncbi:hypothetical protein K470DRAFT_257254 [Piedraia hortae CBS 480.64]|uniref:Uncharacterized protein n=1 Tax=Piedraia hortae CBS 480.64 TaxID=1314780 RepID=A0A6A7C0T5_9PEZI|nr:hypothetical protein K470DRAFT_257254 [Piedraia hortae CBS 480.64]